MTSFNFLQEKIKATQHAFRLTFKVQDVWMGGWIIDGWMDGWMDEQIDEWIAKITTRFIFCYLFALHFWGECYQARVQRRTS